MSVSQGLRFAVLDRDGFRCKYCGKTAGESKLEVDHVIPVTLGGDDTMDNLATSCKKCNRGKAGLALGDGETDSELAMRLKALDRRVDILTGIAELHTEVIRLRNKEMWQIVEEWHHARNETQHNDKGEHTATFALTSCIKGVLARVGFEETLDCVHIALSGHTRTTSETNAIKYLYGVVRNRQTLLEATT